MTDDINALYDTLGDLTKTLFTFKSDALRLDEELRELEPGTPAYRAKSLDREMTMRSLVETQQACEAQKRLIERLEPFEPERARPAEPLLTREELDSLLGIGPDAPEAERHDLSDRDPDRDR